MTAGMNWDAEWGRRVGLDDEWLQTVTIPDAEIDRLTSRAGRESLLDELLARLVGCDVVVIDPVTLFIGDAPHAADLILSLRVRRARLRGRWVLYATFVVTEAGSPQVAETVQCGLTGRNVLTLCH